MIDRFSHSYAVAAPPAAVYAHLMDPHNYIGLSPLIVAVRDVEPVDGGFRYVSVERFRFGPLKWDNPIRVTTTGTPDRQVVSDVRSPGWVTLHSTVDLTADGEGTAVAEAIVLRTPWLLRSFALGQARTVQKARAAELTRRLQRDRRLR